MNIPDRVKDALERAGSSAGEQFLAVAVLTDFSKGLLGLPWAFALSTAAGAALISVLLSVAQFSLGAQALPYWADLLTRTVKTFAASLLATVGTSEVVDVRHVSWGHALNAAGLAAFLALAKNLLSPNAHLSGSLLPAPTVARIHSVALDGGGFSRPQGEGGRTTAGTAIGVVVGIIAIVLLVKGWLLIGILAILAAAAAFVWL